MFRVLLFGVLLFCSAISFADEVYFVIPEGTQALDLDWNSPEEPVIAYVGDELIIINQDSVPHTLHTYRSRPCGHGKKMEAFGGTWSCVLSSTYNAFEEERPTRDHDNASLKFWIIVLPEEDRP